MLRRPSKTTDLRARLNLALEADAVLAYERAVDLYATKGFMARAAAMAKLILAIDPTRGDVLERVNLEGHRLRQSPTL